MKSLGERLSDFVQALALGIFAAHLIGPVSTRAGGHADGDQHQLRKRHDDPARSGRQRKGTGWILTSAC
ncbi:hypothetical protein [Paracoccus sediminicola]|uniref:hypothetical protein n=1 Tax=Paracoccus sediminicola TaxID=3017783 RepID=UPI0022F02FFC|nr:hypothetical protein [Paracoccus sediminicola]WBU58278.1 hypothetical protein PAF18_07610 [Paracoccus sediminicola]